jgi:NADPH-dependent curcumin reductase CurA
MRMQAHRIGREVRLAARPSGRVAASDLVLAEAAVPEPAPGQALVRNHYFSVEPGLRLWIDDAFGLPLPLVPVGQALPGRAVGEVVASAGGGLKPGQLVTHGLGWREYALDDVSRFEVLEPVLLPSLSAYLAPGLTAYTGLDLAELRAGDTVFVSSAAGAVGSLAGQMARLRGAGRVIGSAGTATKVAMLTGQLGFDAAFDYHDGPVAGQLRALAPDGVDVYFDNVGGEQLAAAIEVMKVGGRIVLCGAMASQAAGATPPLPWNQPLIVTKRLRIQGFTAGDHWQRKPEYLADFGRWLRSGDITDNETVLDGLEAAPQAFCDALLGRYAGRVTIRLL